MMETPDSKLKVLVLSSVIPIEESGAGCLTMRRHFLLNDDFDVAVASAREFEIPNIPCHRISSNKIISRLKNTRFSRFFANIEYVLNWVTISKDLVEFSRSFSPDVIFSVVDDFHMGIAWQLSKTLNVPLAIDFQDLWVFSGFEADISKPFPMVRDFIVKKYKFLNERADQVFHVCPGMGEWFQKPMRGDVLYPMPHSKFNENGFSPEEIPPPQKPLTLLYTGNSRGAYGRMLVQLAQALRHNRLVDFRIYALGTDIPDSELNWMKREKIYRGYIPPDQMHTAVSEADALLLVMSFEPDQAIFMKTSFNTKWSDYVSYKKPIFVWGPSYSTATRFAREEGAAIAVSENDPQALINKITEVAENPSAWTDAALSAGKVQRNILNPEIIQKALKDRLKAICHVKNP